MTAVLLQSGVLSATALVGVPLECLVTAIVFADARGAGVDHAGAWTLGVGIILTLLVLGGYGVGTRRAVRT